MVSTMSAVRLDTSTQTLRLESVPVPEPVRGEVRVKIAYAGLCLSDLHFIDGQLAPGMESTVTLGHEAAGVVDAVGPDVNEVQVGDHVSICALTYVGDQTRVMGVHFDGAWAEFTVAPASSLVPLMTTTPLEVAAIASDAVTTPWLSISKTAEVKAGESAGVWGLGGLGYHAIKLLRMVGAVPIIGIDPLEAVRERALAVGADHVLDPFDVNFAEKISEYTAGAGLDTAFDFFGATTAQQQGLDALGRDGRLVLVGIPDGPMNLHSNADFIRSGKRILGHYGGAKSDIARVIAFVERGRLNLSSSVTEVLPLGEFETAVSNLRNKVNNPIRILLRP